MRIVMMTMMRTDEKDETDYSWWGGGDEEVDDIQGEDDKDKDNDNEGMMMRPWG